MQKRDLQQPSSSASFIPSPYAQSRFEANKEAYEYRKALFELIGSQQISWDWFITLTYENRQVSSEKARRDFIRWVRKVERKALPAKEARLLGIRWVRVIEPQADGTPHFHVLLADSRNLSRKKFLSLWPHSKVNKIEAFDNKLKGLRYILKNIPRGADLDLSPTIARQRG